MAKESTEILHIASLEKARSEKEKPYQIRNTPKDKLMHGVEQEWEDGQ
tara:strand:+ start:1758 stop:1901 length:144 start_codon:yes stop_codon:yes gene_type:complete